MIDRKTEQNLKDIKSFLELWVKFHDLFKQTISKDIITVNDEKHFLETRDLIARKYEELIRSFEFRYMPYNRLKDPVMEVLLLKTLSVISEERLKKVGGDWRDSYIFLNNIFERLKSRKRRLERFSTVGVFIKRLLERRVVDKGGVPEE